MTHEDLQLIVVTIWRLIGLGLFFGAATAIIAYAIGSYIAWSLLALVLGIVILKAMRDEP